MGWVTMLMLRDARLFDGVHDRSESAEGDALVGADVDDSLAGRRCRCCVVAR